MRNAFVDYLNTLHNATGANANALAEAQSVNPFYEKIQIHRRVSKKIADVLTGDPCCIILTGHAGDGKTGVLHQVLIDLGITKPSEPIPREGEATIPEKGRALFFVKDMSELTAAEREELLLRALKAPQTGGSAILISNTGPLLRTFESLENSGQLPGSFREFQSDLLDAMDATEPKPISLESYELTLVNMARIDNVGMAGLLLERLTNDDLWVACQDCPAHHKCPILNNSVTVRANLKRTTQFIETYLLWLQEHDARLTLRQVLGQLAYGLTSNLTCNRVQRLPDSKQVLFNYHFANAYWGFRGIQDSSVGSQLKGIRALRNLHLDEISIADDYELFVRKSVQVFDDKTRDLIEDIIRGRLFRDVRGVADPRVRKSVRRFYYLFGSRQRDEDYTRLLAELFSPVLPYYLRIRYGTASTSDLRFVKRAIVRGLYASIVGVPRTDDIDRLHITLRPNKSGITGVQLLLGEVHDDDLSVRPERIESYGDYRDHRQLNVLVLKLRNSGRKHDISLPLLDYLYRLNEGAISTRLNPYLSHGIDKIKASLLDSVRTSEDDMRVLVLTADGPKTIRLNIESDGLAVG